MLSHQRTIFAPTCMPENSWCVPNVVQYAPVFRTSCGMFSDLLVLLLPLLLPLFFTYFLSLIVKFLILCYNHLKSVLVPIVISLITTAIATLISYIWGKTTLNNQLNNTQKTALEIMETTTVTANGCSIKISHISIIS